MSYGSSTYGGATYGASEFIATREVPAIGFISKLLGSGFISENMNLEFQS